ncbi:MAG: ABC transporter permease subunit [Coriobacteriales bacterium]|jgi:NitT/TauT family transport system permease protein|nr:ABC transporter permease subunit [Coriobacteriales bacterium]
MPRVQKTVRKLAAVAFWLVVWAVASAGIANDLILVSPLRVLERLGGLALTSDFWLTVAQSFARIVAGFVLGVSAAVAAAIAASRFGLLRELLEPLVLTIKSIPVASFIVLILIWVASANLAVIIAFLMVLPILYVNVLKGIQRTDPQLLEMADVFRISRLRRVRYIYLSQVLPFFVSGCSVALGMAWKAGVAAEIIGLPDGSLGEMLYNAKLYLSTADIFAWTLVIILVSLVFEKLFMELIRLCAKRLEQI